MPSTASFGGVTRLACGIVNPGGPSGVQVWEFPAGRAEQARLIYQDMRGMRGDPALSPDGKHVGYVGPAPEERGLVVEIASGATVRVLPTLVGNHAIRLRHGEAVFQTAADPLHPGANPFDGVWHMTFSEGAGGRIGPFLATGIAYLTPDGYVSWDANFTRHRPLLAPAFAGDFAIGQDETSGLRATLGAASGYLWPGEQWNDVAACQESADTYAFAAWAPGGPVRDLEDPTATKRNILRIVAGVTEADVASWVAPAEPIAIIGRPILAGFYAGGPAEGGGWTTDVSPHTVPGNCYVAVQDNLRLRRMRDDVVIGREVKVEAELVQTVEEIERKAAAEAYPVAYWDARRWPRWPVLPQPSLLCVQAYCKLTESLAAFEADVREVIASAPAGQPLALVAQCYTSNKTQTEDLRSLVPIYARIVRDCPSIDALLVFSGTGRKSGLQHHPEVLPLWREVFAGIPSPPALEDPMKPPEITVDRWTLDELVDGRELVFHDRENPALGYRCRVYIRDGSLYVEMTNAAGTGRTGARRQVKR
ncbi:MAG: hypothetical protein A3H96_11285 [Acidobacteria bacterium RIFCSPLOWO2_02_FULL_67_36]|nr:MAG: hypothetical protein A3H96_11285 [Acidobacteria bacterium RIFCSPLOWO2_02_FULL_67_36]OFW40506.1 MAG: hypothetical protein A3F70_00895 [Acidobacteria bacterium RIFCSPLOWO2_12_FULL_67_14]